MQRDRHYEIDLTAPVTEQASWWWVLLSEGEATSADRRAFAEWVVRSPERVEAFLQAARVTLALKSDQTRWPDTPVDELIRTALESRGDVASLPAANRRETTRSDYPHESSASNSPKRRLTSMRLAAALGVITLAGIATGLYEYLSPQRFVTSIGEQRSVVLSDGSIVTLNTSSSVEVHMAADRRIVKLLAGEALFQVAHDTQRPFDVVAAETTVRAVGTQFDVDRRPARTTVTVVEGRVAVLTSRDGRRDGAGTPLPLEAGEQLTVSPQPGSRPVRADVAVAIAWTQRKLVFEHRRLGEVAEEFNRYNRTVIEIRSEELRAQEVTGVFQANDPGSFLAFLARIPGVAVSSAPDKRRFIVTQEDTHTTVHQSK